MYLSNNTKLQPPNSSSYSAYSYLAQTATKRSSPSLPTSNDRKLPRGYPQIDQYSEISTSCGSEENNNEDFFDQMPQMQNAFNTIMPSVKALAAPMIQQLKTQKQNGTAPIPEEAKYKTEMCKNWVDTGKCNYGEKCKFAHGKHELVQKFSANKHFKTKPCKQFFEHCFCSYGSRCHFLHDVRTIQEIILQNYHSKQLFFLDYFCTEKETSEDYLSTLSTSSGYSARRLDVFLRMTDSTSSTTSV